MQPAAEVMAECYIARRQKCELSTTHESICDDSDTVDSCEHDAEFLSKLSVPKQECVGLGDQPRVERDQMVHAEPAETGGPLDQPDDRQVEQVENAARKHQLEMERNGRIMERRSNGKMLNATDMTITRTYGPTVMQLLNIDFYPFLWSIESFLYICNRFGHLIIAYSVC